MFWGRCYGDDTGTAERVARGELEPGAGCVVNLRQHRYTRDMFKHVVIQGVGLLGASLGLALKKRGLAGVVTGVGRTGSGSLETARGRGAIDHGSTDLAGAARGRHLSDQLPADLVVLCTPIRQFPEAMRALAPVLAPGTIVTDVGSTKGEVMAWAGQLLPEHVHFVGSHPMAGSEKSGPEAARDNLYENAVCLMCTPYHSGLGQVSDDGGAATAGKPAGYQEAFAKVRGLWRALGMRIIDLPAGMHDQWVATISHLPHAVAFALVATAARHPEMLEAVAGGFLDTTRVASSDAAMWTDIFLTNREALLAAIDAFSTDLQLLRCGIETGNDEAIRAFLTRAKSARDTLLAQREAAGLATRSNHGSPELPGRNR